MTEVTVDIDIDDAVETALGNIDISDYIDNDEVQELQEQMAKLLEVINLPEEPPSTHEIITHAPLEDVRDIYMARREERYDIIRYMSKPELVAWAEENDYDVDGMTVKQIHELVL